MATRVSEGLKPLNDATIQFGRHGQGGTVESRENDSFVKISTHRISGFVLNQPHKTA